MTSEPRTSLRLTGEGRAGESPRAPSVVSKNHRLSPLAPVERAIVWDERSPAAPFRLLSARAPRQAVLRASSGLASRPPRGLATSRRARRAMRSTDFCHLNDLRAPVLRAFPARSAAFAARMPPSCEVAARATNGVSGSVRLTRVPSVSRHSRTLRRITVGHALPCGLELPLTEFGGREHERGRLVPTAPAAIMPLTPLSPLPLARSLEGLRPTLQRSPSGSREPSCAALSA